MDDSRDGFILIGGAGFLGSALTRCLAADGRKVFIVGRHQPSSLAAGITFFPSCALHKLQEEIDPAGVEAIIDLAYATVPSTSVEDPIRDFSENLGCLLQNLEFAQRVHASRYVFVSSGGTVYGDQGQELLREGGEKFPISPYGITKLACEHYSLFYRRAHQLPVVIVRPSNVYGPGQRHDKGQGLVAAAFDAAIRDKPLTIYGDGSQVRDFLYIDDCAEGLVAATRAGEPGEAYNLGSGTGTSIRDLLGIIERIVERDGGRLRVEYRDARPFDVHTVTLDPGKLREASGWTPHTRLVKGLEAAWAWAKGQ